MDDGDAKNAAVSKRAFGRTLSDFWLEGAEGRLHPAERKLIEACGRGEPCVIATERPKAPTSDNIVRAELVRFLALGGDAVAPVHEHGVELQGAWLEGLLDLRAAHVVALHILWSRIEKIDARRAKLQLLDLKQTCLEQGLYGDRLSCVSSIYLRTGFEANGPVRLLGAKIDGMLSCAGGAFDKSINCEGIEISGSLFLRRARIGGIINLSAGRIGNLIDDFGSWIGPENNLRIDGFCYDRIGGSSAFVNASERIAWLKLQKRAHLREDFRPQPWEQLIKVLRESGHPNEARKVAREKQQALRRAGKIKGFAGVLHWLYGVLIGYGYLPTRLLGIMAGVWLGCTLLFGFAANPRATPWSPATSAFTSSAKAPAFQKAAGPEPRPFYSMLYSADALLPIDLGYQSAFKLTPGHPAEPWLLGVTALQTIFGWISSLLLLAVATNLIKKD